MGNHVTDACNLIVVPVSDLRVKIDTQLGEDLPRRAATDTEDIGKVLGKSTPAILAIIYLYFICYTTENYPWRILNLGFFLQIT